MKVTFKKPYSEEDVMFRASQLDSDLKRLGYDDEHRALLIQALYEMGMSEGAVFEEDEFEDIFKQGGRKVNYEVTITETLRRTVIVEAESHCEAEEGVLGIELFYSFMEEEL